MCFRPTGALGASPGTLGLAECPRQPLAHLLSLAGQRLRRRLYYCISPAPCQEFQRCPVWLTLGPDRHRPLFYQAWLIPVRAGYWMECHGGRFPLTPTGDAGLQPVYLRSRRVLHDGRGVAGGVGAQAVVPVCVAGLVRQSAGPQAAEVGAQGIILVPHGVEQRLVPLGGLRLGGLRLAGDQAGDAEVRDQVAGEQLGRARSRGRPGAEHRPALGRLVRSELLEVRPAPPSGGHTRCVPPMLE